MRMSRAILLLALAAGSGCGESHTLTSPGAPASTVPSVPSPPGPIQVNGYVADTAFRALAGVRVQVLGGRQAGVVSTSDAVGRFSLSGTFYDSTRFRATRDDLPGGCTSVSTEKLQHCTSKNHRLTLTRR